MKIEIPHNFVPRRYQVPLFNAIADGYKRGVAVWHRRAGKDKTLVNIIAKEAFKRIGTYYYLFPTYNQGRKVLWDGMDRRGFPFMSHFPGSVVEAKNNTEMKVKLSNGSVVQIVGTDNFDSIMGANPVGCVFSEYALQDPRAWDYLRPILVENGGWALFNFTPRGHNHGFDIAQIAEKNEDWFWQLLTVNDTGVVSPEQIEKERRDGMSDDMIQQEFYCSFDAALPGAYFATEIQQARDDGRISSVPCERGLPVDTWWDLGMDDSTTIWFSQDVGREVHFVDYYECSGEGLQHYAAVLDQKKVENKWIYGRHTAPHDIVVRELGSGISRLETAANLGLMFGVAQRPATKEDAIEKSRNALKICWFDKAKCAHGINALSSYRKEFDDKNRVFKVRPVHDWASHGADAFQTFALAHYWTQNRDEEIERSFNEIGRSAVGGY